MPHVIVPGDWAKLNKLFVCRCRFKVSIGGSVGSHLICFNQKLHIINLTHIKFILPFSVMLINLKCKPLSSVM
jgi:hypothetical protein